MHLVRIRVVLCDDLSRHAGQQCRFAGMAMLLARVGRVPAVQLVLKHPLGRVHHDEPLTIGEAVELRCRLHGVPPVPRHSAAVNCHHHRHRRGPVVLWWHMHLVTLSVSVQGVHVIAVAVLHLPGQAELERDRAETQSYHQDDDKPGEHPTPTGHRWGSQLISLLNAGRRARAGW